MNINEIVNVIDDVKNQIRDPYRLKISFSNPRDPVYVEADRLRLYQVISNLLGNAIKFTREGTISIAAYVNDKIKDKEEELTIAVRDDGTGIDPSIMSRLFTKFATKSEVGTGLGLYISKNIIEAHGGRIWAENNRDGRGATFRFSLPLFKDQEH